MKEDYITLIMGVLTVTLEAFRLLNKCVPIVILGSESECLKTKNIVVPLPVLPKNEQKYSDVIDVLDHYEGLVKDIYHKAGMELGKSSHWRRPVDSRKIFWSQTTLRFYTQQ